MALYFVTVWQSTSWCIFSFNWSESTKRFKMAAIIRFDLDISKITRQDGCCTFVVVQKREKNHQQKKKKRKGKAYLCL